MFSTLVWKVSVHIINDISVVCVLSRVGLCDPMECNLPGSCVHGISQARILEWVAISSSRGYSWPRDQTHISCIGRRILYHRAPREAQKGWTTWSLRFFLAALFHGPLKVQSPKTQGWASWEVIRWVSSPRETSSQGWLPKTLEMQP